MGRVVTLRDTESRHERNLTRRSDARPWTILCAVDRSPGSDRALRRAAHLARQMNARLCVLHLIDVEKPTPLTPEHSERTESLLTARLETVSRILGTAPSLLVRRGDAADAIAAVSEEMDADLLVLGPQRARHHVFTADTPARLLRSAGRPVLIVNREPKGPYRDLLLAVDLCASSARMLRTVNAFGLLEGTRATVMHAFQVPYRGMVARAGIAETHVERYALGWNVARFRELLAYVDAAGVDASQLRILLEDARPLRAVRRSVHRTRPDLLVLGTRAHTGIRRALLGSLAEDVMREISCDVLVVPPPVRSSPVGEHADPAHAPAAQIH